ncbi:MAG: hypothetical protein IPG07_10350 [Crocinitomicaceae bacterium]|nr:hypothetical protein [Crocinitomicaceae bacterium]
MHLQMTILALRLLPVGALVPSYYTNATATAGHQHRVVQVIPEVMFGFSYGPASGNLVLIQILAE